MNGCLIPEEAINAKTILDVGPETGQWARYGLDGIIW